MGPPTLEVRMSDMDVYHTKLISIQVFYSSIEVKGHWQANHVQTCWPDFQIIPDPKSNNVCTSLVLLSNDKPFSEQLDLWNANNNDDPITYLESDIKKYFAGVIYGQKSLVC